MAVKSQIEVSVEAAQFAAFYDRFKSFQRDLDKAPETWRKVGQAAKTAQENNQHVSEEVAKQSESMGLIVGHATTLRRLTDATSHTWKELSRSTANVATNILSATTALLKWAGITSIVGGLVGGGTLYGIDRLGESVSTNRTTSMGLGASYGGLASARANFARFGNVDAMLGTVNEAKTDISKRLGLRQLGLSDEDINGETSDVLAKALMGLKDLADKTPNDYLADTLRSHNVPFDVGTALNLKGRSREEVAGLVKSHGENKKTFEQSSETQRKWQDFSTQMDRAAQTIKNIFIRNLVKLEPGLLNLSKAIVTVVETLMKEDGPIAYWLGRLNKGMEWLAGEIDKPDFQKKVDDFVIWVGKLAEGAAKLAGSLLSWARYMGLVPSAPRGGPAAGEGSPFYGRAYADARRANPDKFGGRPDPSSQGGRRGLAARSRDAEGRPMDTGKAPPEHTGGPAARQAAWMNFLQRDPDLALTREQAAGVVGNLSHESGGFRQYHEGGQPWNRGGVGDAQWTGPRRRQFEAWAAARGLDTRGFEAQSGFMKHELLGSEARSLRALRATRDADEAARVFEQTNERAGIAAIGSRVRRARGAERDDAARPAKPTEGALDYVRPKQMPQSDEGGAGLGGQSSLGHPRSGGNRTSVIINKTAGGNPVMTVAAMAIQ